MTREFWITTLVVVATPGTGALYTIAAGLARGARASLLAAFACTLGIVPHLLAAITGLAALLHASAVAFKTVKYARRRLPALPGLEPGATARARVDRRPRRRARRGA